MNFLLGIISGALMFIGLWQTELLWLHKGWGKEGFVMPFGYVVPWWFARDLWYACIIAAFLIAVLD